jgi:bifunctional UDP-N-acetylglucosamine pyrophosphorylase / glucosamine-1-phosphate N-acetyltransferase
MIVSTVILAAGQGTRMRSNLPKVLHCLAGKPFIEYSLRAAESLGGEMPVVVIGHGADAVRTFVGDRARFALQMRQHGTAHALMMAEPLLAGQSDLVVVLNADMPLLFGSTLCRLIELQTENPGPMTILTILSNDSHGFGHVLRTEDGIVKAIVEETVAAPDQLAIEELNAGVYCFSARWLWPALLRIPASPNGEYYLTDTVELAVRDGLRVESLRLNDQDEAIGINTRLHLAEAETLLRKRINNGWMLAGVTIVDPNATYIGPDVKIGQDTIIYPGTHLEGVVEIGPDCQLGPNAIIKDTTIGVACKVGSSIMDRAVIENHVEIGPFCHLGPGSYLGDGVILGNNVEINDTYLASGVHVPHFSYLGNATVGENVTFGAGAVVCNFDGKVIHPAEIGPRVFIGAGTMIVSPVKVGEGAYTGAGSVVTADVPEGAIIKAASASLISKSENCE